MGGSLQVNAAHGLVEVSAPTIGQARRSHAAGTPQARARCTRSAPPSAPPHCPLRHPCQPLSASAREQSILRSRLINHPSDGITNPPQNTTSATVSPASNPRAAQGSAPCDGYMQLVIEGLERGLDHVLLRCHQCADACLCLHHLNTKRAYFLREAASEGGAGYDPRVPTRWSCSECVWRTTAL